MHRRSLGFGVASALLCLVLTASFVWLGIAPARVTAVNTAFRLPALAGDPLRIDPTLPHDTIRQAIHDAPLSQPVVNVATVSSAHGARADRRAWLAALALLGWRDTTALQNIIADAVQREDIDALVDAADALLRRRVVVDQATQVMSLAEANPGTWPRVLRLLQRDVSWRYDYLARGEAITVPIVLDGRTRTLQTMLKARQFLREQEVRPFVVALTRAQRFQDADALWRTYTSDRKNPVHDPRFTRALKLGATDVTPIAFAWWANSGIGYSTDISSNGLDGAIVSLHWDGRGVPVFLSQQVSTGGRRFALHVKIEGEAASFSERIGFRMRCGDEITAYTLEPRRGVKDLVFTPSPGTTCMFPTLEVFGVVGTTTRSFDGVLTAIWLTPIEARREDSAPKS